MIGLLPSRARLEVTGQVTARTGAATCLTERPPVSALLHLCGQRTPRRRGRRVTLVAALLGGVDGRGAGETETPARNRVPLRVGLENEREREAQPVGAGR